MSRTAKIATVGIAVASLALAGCGQSPAPAGDQDVGTSLDSVIELAKQEGELNYYGSANPALLDVVIPAFEQKYGIKVNVTRLNSGELGQRFLAEGANSPADVVEVPAILFDTSPELFIEMKEVPGWEDYPEEARTSPRNIVTYVSPWAILWNTDLVSDAEAPKSWADLTDPKWQGRFILTDPRSSDSYMGWADSVAERYGMDWLRKIGASNPPLASSGAAGIQQVAAGEYAIGFMHYAGNVIPFQEEGAPLQYVIVEDPPHILPMNMGVTANAPHPNAARLFANYRMSMEAHKLTCDAAPQGSPLSLNGEIESCLKLPAGWKPYNQSISDDRRNELLDALGISD